MPSHLLRHLLKRLPHHPSSTKKAARNALAAKQRYYDWGKHIPGLGPKINYISGRPFPLDGTRETIYTVHVSPYVTQMPPMDFVDFCASAPPPLQELRMQFWNESEGLWEWQDGTPVVAGLDNVW